MTEENKVEDLNPSWKKSSYVRTETDFYEEEELQEELSFSWFSVKSNQRESQQEIDETRAAIQYQIKNGILQPNGLPVGMNIPQPPQPKGKHARKIMREKQREEEKRRKKLQMGGVNMTPTMRKLI